MNAKGYIFLKKDGNMRISKFDGSPQAEEVKVVIHFDVPDKVFMKPIAEAKIKVEESTVTAIPEIVVTADALTNWLKS